jgi:hypothetical protein
VVMERQREIGDEAAAREDAVLHRGDQVVHVTEIGGEGSTDRRAVGVSFEWPLYTR